MRIFHGHHFDRIFPLQSGFFQSFDVLLRRSLILTFQVLHIADLLILSCCDAFRSVVTVRRYEGKCSSWESLLPPQKLRVFRG